MTRHLCRTFVFVLLAIAAGFSSPVGAATVTLSDAGYEVTLNDYPIPPAGPYPVSASNQFGSAQAGLPTSDGQVIPFVKTTASRPGPGGGEVYQAAGENYQFAVLTPTSTAVSVQLSGELSASGKGAAYAEVYSLSGQGVLYDTGWVGGETYDYNTSISVEPNTPYAISIAAITSFSGSGSGSATSDPFLQIDPALVTAGEFLEFSAGVDNVPISATPLPPALPMFGAALLALGGFAWRRRREVAT